MAKKEKKIETLTELQKLVPRLLEEYGKNQKLMKAALSNPILALEEIGYVLSPKVKQEIEERARFTTEQQKKRLEISEKVNKISGMKVDLSSKVSVVNTLKKVLPKKTVSFEKKTIDTDKIFKASQSNRESLLFQNTPKKDPLSKFKSAHEIIPLLLEYRKIEASAPQFATKKIFTTVLKGNEKNSGIAISNVRFRLQERSKRKTVR